MKVTIIPSVICAFATVIKGLVQGPEALEIAGWLETVQTTALLRSAWRFEETCSHLNSSEWPSANADEKNSQGVNNNNNN